MSSSRIRPEDSGISISTMISTSCVMLENLQEFNPPMNEYGYFPDWDYSQQPDQAALNTSTCREPLEEDMVFESEATPFSHETYHGSTGCAGKRIHCEFGNCLLTPLSTQCRCVGDETKTSLGRATNTSRRQSASDSFILQSSVTMSAGEAYFNSNVDYKRLKDFQDLEFDVSRSDRITRDPKFDQCSRWNPPATIENTDFERRIHHEFQSVDWPTFNETQSTLEPNSNSERSWETNPYVSRNSDYKECNEPGRKGFSIINTEGKQTYDCIHPPCDQNVKNDKEMQPWLAKNSFPHEQAGSPSFLNDTSAIKNNVNYVRPETQVMPQDVSMGDPNDTAGRHDSCQEDKTLSVSNLHTFSADTRNAISTQSTNGNNMSPPNYDQQLDTQSMDSASYSAFEKSLDSENNDIPNTAAKYENDGDCPGSKKPSQASIKKRQNNWSIENIQRELELLEERRNKMAGPVNSAQHRLDNYRIQNVANEKGSGMDADYMICSGFTVAGFKPRAIIRKRSKVNIPSDVKDQGYWQKRRKNNDSARKSRELKKEKEKNFYRRALELEYENVYLHECLSLAEAELAAVGRRISVPPMNNVNPF